MPSINLLSRIILCTKLDNLVWYLRGLTEFIEKWKYNFFTHDFVWNCINMYFFTFIIGHHTNGTSCMQAIFGVLCFVWIILNKQSLKYFLCKWKQNQVIDCCSTPSEQLFNYIISRRSYFLMRWWWCLFCTDILSWIIIVLAH